MYSENLLHGAGMEAFNFVRVNLAFLTTWALIFAGLETVLWVALPPSFLIAQLGVGFFLGAFFALAIYRRILSGETAFPPVMDERVLVFIAFGIVHSLLTGLFVGGFVGIFVLERVSVLAGPAPLILSAFMLAGLLWFEAKTILFFPHAAVTPAQSIRLASVWQMSKGLVLPIMLRLAVLGGFAVGLIALFGIIPSTEQGEASLAGRLAGAPLDFIASVLFYLLSACFAALASLIYQRAVNDLRAHANETAELF